MKVLVIGGTGFIGFHVVSELLLRGHQVRLLVRETSPVSSPQKEIEIVHGSLSDPPLHAFENMEGLIHLVGTDGGLLPFFKERSSSLWKINVDYTENIFKAARQMKVRRAVLISTMWTVLRPDLAKISPYIASRVASENRALEESRNQIETSIVCPTFVVGPNDRGPNFPGKMILKSEWNLFSPPGGMTWVSVQDTAKSIVSALVKGGKNTRYIIGAEYLKHSELYSFVKSVSKKVKKEIILKKGILKTLALIGDGVLFLGAHRFSIPLRVGIDLLCLEKGVDCSESWRVLGEPKIKVRDAIKEALMWFQENGYT